MLLLLSRKVRKDLIMFVNQLANSGMNCPKRIRNRTLRLAKMCRIRIWKQPLALIKNFHLTSLGHKKDRNDFNTRVFSAIAGKLCAEVCSHDEIRTTQNTHVQHKSFLRCAGKLCAERSPSCFRFQVIQKPLSSGKQQNDNVPGLQIAPRSSPT